MRHPRRGFTLIEILIVIGIIMLLIGLLVVGFRHINNTAARRETVAELKTLRAMLTEYENHAGLKLLETNDTQTADTTPSAPAPNKFPVYFDPFPSINPANASNSGWPVLNNSDLSGDMSDRSANNRYGNNAVNFTREAMYVLAHVRANRTELQNFTTKRILESKSGTPTSIDAGVVLLDGWGNPIIFVPRAGMHVNIKDPTGANIDYIVRSTETFPASTLTAHPLTGSERPFFASAGQDGDFTIGEDNVYSFQE